MSRKIDWEEEFEFEETKTDNKELLRFVGRILSNWYWFVLCGIIGFAIAFIYVRYTIPTYKIHAKLIVEDDKKGGGMMGASALGELSGIMGAKNSVDNEVEILRTADLMRDMIIKEHAYISYFRMGTVKDAPVNTIPYTVELLSLPDSIAIARRFNIEEKNQSSVTLSNTDTSFNVQLGRAFQLLGVGTLLVTRNAKPLDAEQDYGFTISPLRKVVNAFMQAFGAEVTNKLVSTIDLTFDHQVPKLGEHLLSSLIQEYVTRNLHDKNVVADSTLSFINQRLSRITQELAGVEDRISGYKQATQLADISEQSKILLQNSSMYTKGLAEVETQIAMLDAMATYLQNAAHPRVVPSSVIPQDIAFNGLVSKYNDLVLQRERLLLANTEDNPLVVNITAQIAGLRGDMIANVASSRKNLELTKANQLKLSNTVNSQIKNVPTIERGYIDLARLQQIKQAQYIFLQEKWEETAIGRTANVSNSKIIDSPKAEELPFAPKSRMIYIVGLFLGLLVPLAILYLKDLFNVRISSFEDIERLTKLPILGTISHSEEAGHVVVNNSSRSVIAEQFRTMRTNLEFSLNGGKTIVMTSSMSGEGKSYVALNLAVSLALLDKKVLIMELDLRKPSLTVKLGLQTQKGFSQYVVRPTMQIEEIIVQSGVHDLVDIIQAGAIPPNPAELLVHPRTVTLIEELKEQYDYIIMDAPPVGLVTDAQLLSRYADACLFLVRQDFTYKAQLQIPNDLAKLHKIKNIQLVINDVKAKNSYYANYGYGYGYGYGEYNGETKKKKQSKWKFWV